MKINLFLSALFAVMVSVTSGAEIVITGNDTMQFDLKAFEVKAGEKVSLTLKNTGKLPKIAMGHNLVLLKKGVSAIAFGQKAMGAGANATNPLPDSVKEDVIAAPNFSVRENQTR